MKPIRRGVVALARTVLPYSPHYSAAPRHFAYLQTHHGSQ